MRQSYAWSIFWTTTFVKLFMLPLYHSTDFDVHRNWLAVTHSLPVSQWYTDHTSEWTLDYPPLFAWFEWALSWPAGLADPAMLAVQEAPYRSHATLLFQRLSVVASDLVLYFALLACCGGTDSDRAAVPPPRKGHASAAQWGAGAGVDLGGSYGGPRQRRLHEVTVLVLAFASPGLLMVDHIHFQYNGFLLGVLVWSLAALRRGQDLLGGVLFAAALNLKHIFLYVAPVYFVYLLRHYCFPLEGLSFRGWEEYRRGVGRARRHFSAANFCRLAAAVVAVFAVSFGPFAAAGQLGQVLSRLFPFKRGLCHAYWAPNFWAVYSGADLALARVVLPALGLPAAGTAMTGGLVHDAAHAVLPAVPPLATGVLTLLTMSPALLSLWRYPHPRTMLTAVVYATMCSYMLGWHVHEKAVLMVTLPLSLVACNDLVSSKAYIFLSVVGNYSLFPLFFSQNETAVKVVLLALHSYVVYHILERERRDAELSSRIARPPLLSRAELAYLFGFFPLQAFVSAAPLVLPRLPFLPLLATSLYCSLGTMYGWLLLWRVHSKQVTLVRSFSAAA